MAILSRFTKEVPPTADDTTAVSKAADLDPENQGILHTHSTNGNPGQAQCHVTPNIEKRVLRKLDTRLVPLVMFLCGSNLGKPSDIY
jgi:hypothetical protein